MVFKFHRKMIAKTGKRFKFFLLLKSQRLEGHEGR